MEFNPTNPIVQRCLQGMEIEANGQQEEASKVFLDAWNEATNDYEKFLGAYYVARQQTNVREKLNWLETALQLALKINDHPVNGAFAPLYESIAKCYEELNEHDNSQKHYELAKSYPESAIDNGPFYHGTKADLQVGDFLTAGYDSNYKAELTMNHIYFTALPYGAGLAAALAKGDGRERVYIVEPTAAFENDPNVTNKKFPGNPTRSYRTEAPLKIVAEITDWARQTPEDIRQWREKLAKNQGEIIN
jgi:tetratricopeptide (TPR) repeat protein